MATCNCSGNCLRYGSCAGPRLVPAWGVVSPIPLFPYQPYEAGFGTVGGVESPQERAAEEIKGFPIWNLDGRRLVLAFVLMGIGVAMGFLVWG